MFKAELVLVEGGGHFPWGKDLKPSTKEIYAKIQSFLDKHLEPK